MTFDWESYPQFMDALDRLPKGVNLLPYVPMNPLMGYVMGIEESKTGRMPTDDEHAQMRQLAARGDGCGCVRMVGAAADSERTQPRCSATSTARR